MFNVHYVKLKGRAIELRRRGYSYTEILNKVPVAKSTLSLWLRSVGLTKKKKQRLTNRRRAAVLRGGLARRNQRLDMIRKIVANAQKYVSKFQQSDLWIIGVMLYWAEGSKQKPNNPSQCAQLTNSDHIDLDY